MRKSDDEEGERFQTMSTFTEHVYHLLQKQPNAEGFLLEFKYSKLKMSYAEPAYKKILKDSMKDIILLNNRYDHRKHKINAKASKEEFKNCLNHCEEICEKNKCPIQSMVSANIYLRQQDSHFYKYIVGNEGPKQIKKSNLFERQYDIVYKKKQFRANLCQIKLNEKQKAKDLFKEHGELKTSQVQTIRFKCEKKFPINSEYDIVISNIFEIKSAQGQFKQELDDLMKVLAKNEKEKLDQYITGKIQTDEKNKKYEIQLRITEKGNERMKRLQRNQLTQYLGRIFLVTFDLSSNQSSKLYEEMNALSLGQQS